MRRIRSATVVAYAIAILVTSFFVLPILGLLIMSVKPPAIIDLPTMLFVPTLRNYERLFLRTFPSVGTIPTNFIPSLVNSLFVSGLTTFLVVFLAALSSYAFSRFRFRGRFALGVYIFVCYSVPALALLYPIHFILINLDIYDTYMGIITIQTILTLPWTLWMLKSFFDSVPKDLEESGMLDGCSRFGAFTRITIPISAPGLAVVSIFTFVSVWNSFLPMIILTGQKTKPFIVFLLENSGWGTLAAGSIISIIPTLVLALLIRKYIARGFTLGYVND